MQQSKHFLLFIVISKSLGFSNVFFFQGPEGDKAKEMALVNPSHYVLKPQREGGGRQIRDKVFKNGQVKFVEDSL